MPIMHRTASRSRREFLRHALAFGGGAVCSARSTGVCAAEPPGAQPADRAVTAGIAEAAIRAGVETAVTKTLDTAALERVYPGHFTVTADGRQFGSDTTWPGLDSWELAGAYLLLGRTRLVLDYFDFVEASQRKDGNIPFGVWPADPPPDRSASLRGMKYPDDIFVYKPRPRAGRLPQSDLSARRWVGLFTHWQIQANPLSTLGSACYLLTAAEIYDATRSVAWLREKLPSIVRAAEYLFSRREKNGLIGGAGFYAELPPRSAHDGITQCYGVFAFRQLARLLQAAGRNDDARQWRDRADRLASDFSAAFWRNDHFGEYVHPSRGLVDRHGLSDVNWAAIGLDVADARQCDALWPRLLREPGFWHGDMPTQTVTRPFSYEEWEFHEKLPFPISNPTYDVAAMGRAWYVEALACRRMNDRVRLVESVRKVCAMGRRHGGQWHDRYHAQPDGSVRPAGPPGYCEYAAVLVRVVLSNRDVFAATS
jgi:hypothetical protein